MGEWDVQYYDKLNTAAKASSLVMAGPCYPVFVSYTPVLNRWGSPGRAGAQCTAPQIDCFISPAQKCATQEASFLIHPFRVCNAYVSGVSRTLSAGG